MELYSYIKVVNSSSSISHPLYLIRKTELKAVEMLVVSQCSTLHHGKHGSHTWYYPLLPMKLFTNEMFQSALFYLRYNLQQFLDFLCIFIAVALTYLKGVLVLNSEYILESKKGPYEAYHLEVGVIVGTDLFCELSAFLHAYMERLIKEPNQQIPWADFRNIKKRNKNFGKGWLQNSLQRTHKGSVGQSSLNIALFRLESTSADGSADLGWLWDYLIYVGLWPELDLCGLSELMPICSRFTKNLQIFSLSCVQIVVRKFLACLRSH